MLFLNIESNVRIIYVHIKYIFHFVQLLSVHLNMKKEHRIEIRVSPEEKQGFEKAAEIAGIGVSAWARQKLRAAAIKELQEMGEKIVFLTPIPLNKKNG